MNDQEIDQQLSQLDGWERHNDRISKQFLFTDFNEAFGWMTLVAISADKADHHPEWKNVYNRVDVELSTHDAGGITEKDFRLAAVMNRFHAKLT